MRIERCGSRCVLLDARPRDVRSNANSGRRSPTGFPVRTPRLLLVCRRQSGPGGSVNKELFWIDESNQRFYAYNYFGDHPEKLIAWFDQHLK